MAIVINGSTGIQMAADDSLEFGTVGISQDTLFSGRKNVIINGDFDVWQRGTGAFTSGVYTADRWLLQNAGTTSTSATQQSFTIGQTDVPNEPKYYWQNVVVTSSAVGEFNLLTQRVESVRTFSGQTVTLSFWAKADAAKDIAVEFEQQFGEGGSPSTSFDAIGVTTCSLTTSWQKFEVTVAIPSISGKTVGTTHDGALSVNLWMSAGSNFNARTNSLGNQSGTFDIAQVQLEKGSQATAFEKRSYGEELALCQRYYQLLNTSTVYGQRGNSNNFIMYARHTVPMRTTPTGDSTGSSTNSGTVYLSPVDNLGTRYGAINCTVDNIASTTVATLDAEL